MTISQITILVHRYAYARAKLIGRCSIIQRAINRLKFNNLPILRLQSDKVMAAYIELYSAVDASRELFEKPKTITVDDIKFGLRKQKGTMTWDDEDKVVERIKNMFDEEAGAAYIRVKEAPDRAALSKLSGDELKKLGITVTADTDVPTITASDTEMEKLAAAFLSEEKET